MRRTMFIAAAFVALTGLSACGSSDQSDGVVRYGTDPEETATAAGDFDAADADGRLEMLVGTWEADTDDVGPHGSTLAISEDGTATLLSFASQQGTFEGEVFLGDGDPHRFDGTIPESGTEISVQLTYDADTDTLTLAYPDEGGEYVHTRV